MPRIPGYFEYDDGLTPGRSKDGGIHHNLYDQGHLKGHAKFFPSDEEDSPESPPVYVFVNNEVHSDPRATERSQREKELIELAQLLLNVAVKKAEPIVKEWWNEQGRPALMSTWNKRPALKSTWNKIAGSRGARSQATAADVSTVIAPAPASPSQEAAAVPKEDRVTLTSTEAWDLFVAALRARHFSEEALEVLRSARIEDGNGNLELTSAMENLRPQQIEDAIQLMLEMNPSPLNDDTMAELRKILERTRAHGWRGLSRNEGVKETLHLRDGEK